MPLVPPRPSAVFQVTRFEGLGATYLHGPSAASSPPASLRRESARREGVRQPCKTHAPPGLPTPDLAGVGLAGSRCRAARSATAIRPASFDQAFSGRTFCARFSSGLLFSPWSYLCIRTRELTAAGAVLFERVKDPRGSVCAILQPADVWGKGRELSRCKISS